MPRIVKLIAVAAVFAVGALVAPHSPITLAFQGTPAAPPAVIASEVLGHATPAVAENPELALGRVTIIPGAAIPVHYHAGIQIGVAVQGELTYTVFGAKIAWYRGDSPTDDPRIIEPGETVVARAVDALVESPGAVHQDRNDGDVPLIIYLSTFFPAGAPSAVIVDATPIP